MNAHIFFELGPRLFLYFWGVLDMENTLRQLKKSKRSILFDANRKKIPKKIFAQRPKLAPVLKHMIIKILKIILFNYKKLKSILIPGKVTVMLVTSLYW